jgi:hypothetical protein
MREKLSTTWKPVSPGSATSRRQLLVPRSRAAILPPLGAAQVTASPSSARSAAVMPTPLPRLRL